jgi:hypothetical protein
MRKTISLIVISIITTIIIAQPNTFVFKAQMIGGSIIPTSNNIKNINPNPSLGGELAIEFPSWNEYAWQQYLNKPTLGVGFVGLDLGNNKILGQSFAVYPYILIDIVKLPHFELNWKAGTGLSFFNKTYNRCDTIPSHFGNPTTNTLIGSIVNVYLTTGINFNIPITKQFASHAEFGYMHMSNGSVLQPNGGVNILYASIGASYILNKNSYNTHNKKEKFPPLPYKWSINITGSGGYRELYYLDNKGYGIGSIHIGATYNICNWYTLGGGLDIFYDGAFNQQGGTQLEGLTQEQRTEQLKHTRFGRYVILNENLSNKFRIGVGINNEFKIGRVTALLDWGIYLYDPIRLAHYTDNTHKYKYEKRPLFYKYDIEKEDGWNYFRLGLRYRVWDNIYMQVAVKTHLSKAEMVEWGVGYQIPFKPKFKDNDLLNIIDGWTIHHQ